MAKETGLSLPLEPNEHQHVVTGQLVGYARVSTPDQNLDRQVSRLQKAGATEIYKEKIGGASRERPQLEEMLRYLRKGGSADRHEHGSAGAVVSRHAHHRR